MNKGYEFVKRIIDIIGSIFGILILAILIIFIVILKKIFNDKTPLFYSQDRVGKNNKIFKMYKFCSMIPNADKILEEYLKENEQLREEYNLNQKLKDDPRITKLGKILRKTSIDEFPQFINVLKGQMSLVGPRPYLPAQCKKMGEYSKYIIPLKPGITGLWQIKGRSKNTFKKRLELDKKYYEKRSLLFDFFILFKTIGKVIDGEGAI